MATEQKVDSELLRGDCRPMRRFPGDEGVDILPVRLGLRGNAINFSSGAAGDDSNVFWILRTGVECFHGFVKHLSQLANQFLARSRRLCANTDQLAFFFKERLGRSESKR